jgi:HSP20 family protein
MKLPVQKTERRKEPMSLEAVPWTEPRALMERFFPESWIRPWFDWEKGFYREMESWMPRVDVSETEKEYQIEADVPGVKPEDIKVEISGDTLILSGKSEEEKEEKGKTWHRIERRSGSFYREFELPKGADTDQVEATAKNGTLTVRLMKKPEAQSKTIEVKVKEGGE